MLTHKAERKGIEFSNSGLSNLLRFTALHWCVEMGSEVCLSLLLQDSRIKKDIKDKKGRTPAELAKDANEELFKILMQR